MQNDLWHQMKQLFGLNISMKTIFFGEWDTAGFRKYPMTGDIRKLPGLTRIAAAITDTAIHVWDIQKELTPLEEELIRLLLLQENDRGQAGEGEEGPEKLSRQHGEWMEQHLASRDLHASLPGSLGLRSRLQQDFVSVIVWSSARTNCLPIWS